MFRILLLVGAGVACSNGPSAAPIPCGATTCGGSQVCVTPCCGGEAPSCIAESDAGGCPPRTHFGQCTNTHSSGPCVAEPCTPAAPFCADGPADAAATSFCSYGTEIQDRLVLCLCE